MCRLLFVKSKQAFNVEQFITPFAEMCENSRVFQGHGWGFAALQNGRWKYYKNIAPVWEDKYYPNLQTTMIIAHARSAFEDKGIRVENNMPFYDNKYVFVFNGELRNVKIKSAGRIGAEKVFNFIKRFDKGNIADSLQKATGIIKKRTGNLRGMNIIITDAQKAYVYSTFTNDKEYFTMRIANENWGTIICSEQINIKVKWEKILTSKVQVFE